MMHEQMEHYKAVLGTYLQVRIVSVQSRLC